MQGIAAVRTGKGSTHTSWHLSFLTLLTSDTLVAIWRLWENCSRTMDRSTLKVLKEKTRRATFATSNSDADRMGWQIALLYTFTIPPQLLEQTTNCIRQSELEMWNVFANWCPRNRQSMELFSNLAPNNLVVLSNFRALLSQPDESGLTPLLWAVKWGKLEIIEVFAQCYRVSDHTLLNICSSLEAKYLPGHQRARWGRLHCASHCSLVLQQWDTFYHTTHPSSCSRSERISPDRAAAIRWWNFIENYLQVLILFQGFEPILPMIRKTLHCITTVRSSEEEVPVQPHSTCFSNEEQKWMLPIALVWLCWYTDTFLGETPLHRAVFNTVNAVEIATLLLDQGADINVQAKKGDTALHYAIW